MHKKTKKQKQIYNSIASLTGGKFIDKGAFGCVVSPAIPCTSNDKNIDKSVSKIIKKTDKYLNNEIKISNILKKLDPKNKYYVTFNKYCYINSIPETRTDIISVHYKDDDLEKFSIDPDQGVKDKHKCDIEIALRPVNIIMDFAGYSLSNIMKTKMTDKSTRGIMHRLFVDNIQIYLRHLILGIVKMHNNRIVNHDIKPRNIMLNWHKDTNEMDVKYIDFGLSDFLTSDFCSQKNNISSKGTSYYLSPDIVIAYYIRSNEDMPNRYILKNIIYDIDKYLKKMFTDIQQTEMLGNLEENVINLYRKIKNLYDDDKFLNVYFGSEKNKFNGYLQKNDIYALGTTIFEVLQIHSNINVKDNKLLYDLLVHMIAFDPDKRYNGIQCLAHPYFHKK